jgi:hypothetical protein
MGKKSIVSAIVHSFIPGITVDMTQLESASVTISPTIRGEIVTDIVIEKMEFPFQHGFLDRIIGYLTQDLQPIVRKYHPMLFAILHEVGHSKTYVGYSIIEIQEKKRELFSLPISFEEKTRLYRQIPSERRADEWAVNWLIENARKFSKYLSKLYK